MVEALSVLGAAGTTAGLISFVTTASETVYKRYQDLKEGHDRLVYCNIRIICAEQKLRNWRNTWTDEHQHLYSNQTYQRFWGDDGLKNIQNILDLVLKELNHLREILYCDSELSSRLSRQDRQLWRTILRREDHPAIETDQMEHTETLWGKLRRILFKTVPPSSDIQKDRTNQADTVLENVIRTFMKGAHIKESIDRLHDGVNSLEAFSRTEYWMRLATNADTAGRINPADIKGTEDLRQHLKETVTQMREICVEDQSTASWALVLGKPAPEEAFRCLENGIGFQLEFIATHNDALQLLTLTFNPTPLSVSGPLRDIAALRDYDQSDFDPEMSFKTLLQQTADTHTRKALQWIFGVVAIKLVRSVVLLHNAPWTSELCTCGIMRADKANMEDGICIFKKRLTHACHNRSTGQQRFLHLAVALFEFSLETQVKIVLFDEAIGRYKFKIRERDNTRWNEKDEDLLLLDVLTRTASTGYKQALQSCLMLAKAERSNAEIRPEYIRNSHEQIVTPVTEYWEAKIIEGKRWCQAYGGRKEIPSSSG